LFPKTLYSRGVTTKTTLAFEGEKSVEGRFSKDTGNSPRKGREKISLLEADQRAVYSVTQETITLRGHARDVALGGGARMCVIALGG